MADWGQDDLMVAEPPDITAGLPQGVSQALGQEDPTLAPKAQTAPWHSFVTSAGRT